MFRKLLPSVFLLLLVGIIALLGCSKKPSDYEAEDNYAPQGMTAFPDTNKVVVKWDRNSEAESQAGFGGYVVYCTSRKILSSDDNDSIVGLTLLQDDSLRFFEIPGCPLVGVDSAVITVDPTTDKALAKGTKYYFYVRSIVDGQLSWAAKWVWSSPRPIGYGTIYAFTPFDTLTGANGLNSNFQFLSSGGTIVPKLYTTPIFKWHLTYFDFTPYWPNPGWKLADTVYAKSLNDTMYTTTPFDTVVCGFVEWDSIPRMCRTIWKDTLDTLQGKVYKQVLSDTLYWYRTITTLGMLYNSIDLVLEKVPGNPSQVRLTSPTTVSTIPVAAAWNKGRETLIQSMPAGYGASVPDAFGTSAYSVVLDAASVGNVYQIKTAGSNYAKIQIDSVVTSGNTTKVCFRYAFQMAANILNF